ncbi:MAG: FG-GAP-like repeat-containing protein, partial [Thermomicrobiales bacterium]
SLSVKAFSGGLNVGGAEIWTQAHSNLSGISPEKDDQFGGVKDDAGTKLFSDTLASGDFDGDGFYDLAIGTPYENVGGKTDAGMVVVLYSDGPLGIWTNGYQAIDLDDGNLPGNKESNFLGAWMTVGDYDNDGYDDLAISAGGSGLSPTIQKLYILPGGPSGLSRNTFQTIDVDSLGWDGALASGDLSGDGYDDLAVSSPNFGKARLYWGSGSGLVNGGCPESGTFGCPTSFGDDDLINELGLTDVKVPGVDKSLFGNSLAIGDLNNDGYDDLAIGDPYADAEANCADVLGFRVDCDEGGVYIIYGSSSLDDSGGDWNVTGEFVHQEGPSSDTNEWHDAWGRSVAIGDFDGDGYGDLAVGAPQEDHGCVQAIIFCDNVGKGSITVIYGNSGGLSNSTKRLTQENLSGFSNEANDRFGEYLAVGSFNGDSADDYRHSRGKTSTRMTAGGMLRRGRRALRHSRRGAEGGSIGAGARKTSTVRPPRTMTSLAGASSTTSPAMAARTWLLPFPVRIFPAAETTMTAWSSSSTAPAIRAPHRSPRTSAAPRAITATTHRT